MNMGALATIAAAARRTLQVCFDNAATRPGASDDQRPWAREGADATVIGGRNGETPTHCEDRAASSAETAS